MTITVSPRSAPRRVGVPRRLHRGGLFQQQMSLNGVREFLAGSAGIDLQPQRRADAYTLGTATLKRFDHALCGKADKCLLRRFLGKATGPSRAQVTHLLRQHRTTGGTTDRRGAPRRSFAGVTAGACQEPAKRAGVVTSSAGSTASSRIRPATSAAVSGASRMPFR